MAEALTLELDEETSARLELARRRREVSLAELVRDALTDFLEREEASTNEFAEDEARWAEYKATGRSVPNDDVIRWLRSIGTDDELPCPQ